MHSFALLSLLSFAGAVSAGTAHFVGVHQGHGHRDLAKRVSVDLQHNKPTFWNHEKRQADGARMTWYNTGQGACGGFNTDNDMIVAINEHQWNGGAVCGKQIEITVNGKTATATITDLCPFDSCPFGALDLSPGLFKTWADDPAQVGTLSGSWKFAGEGGGGQKYEEPTTTQEQRTTSSSTEQPTSTSSTSTTSSTSITSTSQAISTTSQSSDAPSASPTSASLAAGSTDGFDEFLSIFAHFSNLIAAGAKAA